MRVLGTWAALLFCILTLLPPASGQVEWRRSARPNAEFEPPMVTYDTVRNRVVIAQQAHDGRQGMEIVEWDGVQWYRPLPPLAPRLRGAGSFVFDPLRARCVLFGGGWWDKRHLGDTWEWDGRAWTEVQTPRAPSPRRDAAACFDEALGKVVVFGGDGLQGGQPALLGDLWAFDGAAWQQLSSSGTGTPAPRSLHTSFYDSVVGELVLYGGFIGNNAFVDDTWSWRSGQGWRRLATNGAPSPRGWHQAAFDKVRGVGVLYGQYLLWNNEETWEWTGSLRRWTLVTKQPPGGLRRQGPGLCFDGKTVLLYGGNANYEAGLSGSRSDLYHFDASTVAWQPLSPSTPPGGRWVMAQDSQRGRLLAYRSDHAPEPIWERGIGAWQAIVPSNRIVPDSRWHPALADTYKGSVLLFGGENYTRGLLDEGWLFDGKAWSKVSSTGPSARSRVAMAGVPWGGGQVLAYGGLVSQNPDVGSDELWIFSGSSWQPITKQLLWPPALHGAGLVFDARRNRVVLFGGRTVSGDSQQTWEWDGTRWYLVNPLALAPAMYLPRMSYDPRLAACLTMTWQGETWAYDGNTWARLAVCEEKGVGAHHEAGIGFDPIAGETVVLSDTAWVLERSDRARFETWGVGCPRSPVEPRLESQQRPILGTTIQVDAVWPGILASSLVLGSSRTWFGNVPLPIAVSGLGVDGCWLQVAPELPLPTTSVTSQRASFALPLPNDPAWNGRCVFVQALVLKVSSFGMTDAAMLRIGKN